MIPNKCRTWLEIDLDSIVYNYLESTKLLKSGCQIISVLKADAYGLGAVPIARALWDAGCNYFAVAYLDEAIELREKGILSRLLTFTPIPETLSGIALCNHIESPVVSFEQAKRLSDSLPNGARLNVHIKLDLGLSRIGIPVKDRWDEAMEEILKIFSLPRLQVVALMGHITGSRGPGGDVLNRSQLKLYDDMSAALEEKGLRFEKHCLSSQPFLKYPAYAHDFVRLGALLYGSMPGFVIPFKLKPSVGLYSKVIQVKSVPPGTPVSYGPEYHTLRQTTIATIGLGFSDGIRRSVVNGGAVLLRGRKVPFIGVLCSDYAMLDVTDVPHVAQGDTVTIFGCSGDLIQGIEDYAAIYPASVSETTSQFSKRLPRFYLRHNNNFCKE